MKPSGTAGTPAASRPAPARTTSRVGVSAKTPVLASPNLGKDLRRIGIVTVVLAVLVIVLWLVLS